MYEPMFSCLFSGEGEGTAIQVVVTSMHIIKTMVCIFVHSNEQLLYE